MIRCPDCGAGHDPRPCAQTAAMCDCCRAMFDSASHRQQVAELLDDGRPSS